MLLQCPDSIFGVCFVKSLSLNLISRYIFGSISIILLDNDSIRKECSEPDSSGARL